MTTGLSLVPVAIKFCSVLVDQLSFPVLVVYVPLTDVFVTILEFFCPVACFEAVDPVTFISFSSNY
jgi:hypothetical protein